MSMVINYNNNIVVLSGETAFDNTIPGLRGPRMCEIPCITNEFLCRYFDVSRSPTANTFVYYNIMYCLDHIYVSVDL